MYTRSYEGPLSKSITEANTIEEPLIKRCDSKSLTAARVASVNRVKHNKQSRFNTSRSRLSIVLHVAIALGFKALLGEFADNNHYARWLV